MSISLIAPGSKVPHVDKRAIIAFPSQVSNQQPAYPPKQPPKAYWTTGKILAFVLVVILLAGVSGIEVFNYVRQNSLFGTSSNTCSNGATNHPSCNSCPSTQYYDSGQCRNGDFTMTPTQPNPVSVGSYAASTISITTINGFTGTITLVETSIPVVLACIISPVNVTDHSGPATILCNASVAGNYDLVITGTRGSLSHSVSLTFRFQDFAITATAPLNSGAYVDSTITVTALNGYANGVILTGSLKDTYGDFSIACEITPDNMLTGSGIATLSCSSGGTPSIFIGFVFQLTVNGTSGSLRHTAVGGLLNCQQNTCSF